MKDKYYFLSLRISWISIAVNFIIIAIKVVAGIISNSISILSDAIHSLSDLLSTAVVIASLFISRKPADFKHPFGHGRAEDIGGLSMSFILMLIAIGFIRNASLRLISPQVVDVNYFVISIISVTALIKLFLGSVTNKIAKRISSSLLKTDAFHHYSDFLTTVAIVGGLFLIKEGLYIVDSILAIAVSLLIISWALKTGKGFIDNLLGKSAPQSLYEKVKEIALSFQFVGGVHGIEIHTYGRKNIICLHIELSPSLSLEEAHRVADSIEKKIYREGLGKCIVHADLKKTASAFSKAEIERTIRQLVVFTKRVKDFHGLRIITLEEGSILNFDLLLDRNTPLEESHLLTHKLTTLLKKKFNFSQVNIHVEPYQEKGGE